MDVRGLGLVERRSAMVAAAQSMVGFADAVHEASDGELAELMSEADAVAARAAAVRAQVVVEAVRRGVVADSDLNPHGWVREFAPSLRQGGAGVLAKLATEVAGSGRSAGSVDAGCGGGARPWVPAGFGVGGGEGGAGVAGPGCGDVG